VTVTVRVKVKLMLTYRTMPNMNDIGTVR